MRSSGLDEIARELVVGPNVAPAAVVAIAFRAESNWRLEAGAAGRTGQFAANERSFFDLASVTKPVVAATAARLARAGRLSLKTPLGELLSEARGTHTGAQSLELLLAHRAGLEAHRPLFAALLEQRPFERRSALEELLRARRPECREVEPRSYPPLYSDLGYALVGLALEAREQAPLDEIVRREVCEPLGLNLGSVRQLRARWPEFAERCAPTESVLFRGGLVHAIVHDENAWALSGHALSGHAGLFGDAMSVARFGAALLDAINGRSEVWLRAGELAELVRERDGGSLRAGFDGKSERGSSAGSLAGGRSFGHLGFTGTSLWCDPDADRVLVLLSNRVCPSRDNVRIRAARPAVHDALFRAAQAG
ncbi:MAG TPA: serine hydrolase [Polyangiaceae bacterium]|jgi:CubicO group peptidase (beta-lactamase class C family)|nr:serine hydrolase [Polyangiaceae bacterium]